MYTTYLVSYSNKRRTYVGVSAGTERQVITWKTKEELLKYAKETENVILAFQPKTLELITSCG
jgi:hypothetical protein